MIHITAMNENEIKFSFIIKKQTNKFLRIFFLGIIKKRWIFFIFFSHIVSDNQIKLNKKKKKIKKVNKYEFVHNLKRNFESQAEFQNLFTYKYEPSIINFMGTWPT